MASRLFYYFLFILFTKRGKEKRVTRCQHHGGAAACMALYGGRGRKNVIRPQGELLEQRRARESPKKRGETRNLRQFFFSALAFVIRNSTQHLGDFFSRKSFPLLPMVGHPCDELNLTSREGSPGLPVVSIFISETEKAKHDALRRWDHTKDSVG